ncbi:retinoblastoma-associated protein A domain-containing protein [Jimgerdemannia flammicorona]|uniref:Retinoblastoma-associated protein A domain-containing protein n=1 Tax=Jimgerdemannia flammicorona TaxID=994334 RepID=A0A433QTI7_9FUNG|nr:retinoblastoma-associated protein A domain-containing protein [Jimgerdemannia flammicorona]
MTQFLRGLKDFLPKSHLDLTDATKRHVEESASQLENGHNVIQQVYNKFNDLFHVILRYDFIAATRMDLDSYPEDMHRFTWLFFLLIKDELLPKERWTVSVGLVYAMCCVNFAATQVDKTFRRGFSDIRNRLSKNDNQPGLYSVPAMLVSSDMEAGDWLVYHDTIKQLMCRNLGVSWQDYLLVERTTFLKCVEAFFGSGRLNLGEHEPISGFLWPRFPQAFNRHRNECFLVSNIKKMEYEYELLLHQQGIDFDGRSLYVRNKGLGTSLSIAGFVQWGGNYEETPRKIRQRMPRTPEGVKSPAARSLLPVLQKASVYNQQMPSTPLTARTLSSRSQNKRSGLVDELEETQNRLTRLCEADTIEPTPTMQAFFAACLKGNPYRSMMGRVHDVLNWFTNKAKSKMDIWNMAIKLHWRIFENMLIAEQTRLKKKDMSHLLHQEAYHRSVMTCAVELLRFAFRIESMTFQEFLYAFKVRPFEFGLVIEMIVRREQSRLPWPCVRRMKEIEERILESEVWREEDPLYTLLRTDSEIAQQGGMTAQAQVLLDMSERTSGFCYEVAVSMASEDPGQEGNSMMIKPKTRIEPLNLFFRKLYRMVHTRLLALSKTLMLPETVIRQGWDVLIWTLDNELKLRMLQRRHTDLVMMCVVFGVSKLNGLNVPFNKIVSAYRQQPQYMGEIFRNVYISEGAPHTDIVQYYNKIFLPNVKDVLYAAKSNVSDR